MERTRPALTDGAYFYAVSVGSAGPAPDQNSSDCRRDRLTSDLPRARPLADCGMGKASAYPHGAAILRWLTA